MAHESREVRALKHMREKGEQGVPQHQKEGRLLRVFVFHPYIFEGQKREMDGIGCLESVAIVGPR